MFQNAEPIIFLKITVILRSRDQQLPSSTSDAALTSESPESLERRRRRICQEKESLTHPISEGKQDRNHIPPSGEVGDCTGKAGHGHHGSPRTGI